MDAKRILPILNLASGTPATPEAVGRLELAGADEILLREGPDAPRDRGWLRAVARSVFIPVVLEGAFADLAEVAQALESGADRVILAPDAASLALLTPAVRAFGRTRLGVAVNARATSTGWRVAGLPQDPERAVVDWMRELEQLGAGEILLEAGNGQEAAGDLFGAAAHLALPILCRCGPDAWSVGTEALLHGADGVAFSGSRSPAEFKAALADLGLALR